MLAWKKQTPEKANIKTTVTISVFANIFLWNDLSWIMAKALKDQHLGWNISMVLSPEVYLLFHAWNFLLGACDQAVCGGGRTWHMYNLAFIIDSHYNLLVVFQLEKNKWCRLSEKKLENTRRGHDSCSFSAGTPQVSTNPGTCSLHLPKHLGQGTDSDCPLQRPKRNNKTWSSVTWSCLILPHYL